MAATVPHQPEIRYTILAEIKQLSIPERIRLVGEIWDAIAAEAPEELSLTEAEQDELHRRYTAHQAEPSTSIPWQQVRANLWQNSRDRAPNALRITAELVAEPEGGYTVYCPELDIYTQGETESECVENLREAAELYLETLGKDAVIRRVIYREIEVSPGA